MTSFMPHPSLNDSLFPAVYLYLLFLGFIQPSMVLSVPIFPVDHCTPMKDGLVHSDSIMSFAVFLCGTRNFFLQVNDDASPICTFLDLNTE